MLLVASESRTYHYALGAIHAYKDATSTQMVSESLCISKRSSMDPCHSARISNTSNFRVLYALKLVFHSLSNAVNLINKTQSVDLFTDCSELFNIKCGAAEVHGRSMDIHLFAEVSSCDGAFSKGHIVSSRALILEETFTRCASTSISFINNKSGTVLACDRAKLIDIAI